MYAHVILRCFDSVSHRVVTIGPLFVLGLLGVTFYIGARLATPVEANVLPIPQARSTYPSDTSVLPTVEPLTPRPALQAVKTSGISAGDTAEEVGLSTFGPAPQSGRASGGAGDSMAVSTSSIRETRAGAFAGQQHLPAGRVEESSGTNIPPASLHDTTINRQNKAMGHTTRGAAGSSATATHEDTHLSQTRRALARVLKPGAENKTDPKRVNT